MKEARLELVRQNQDESLDQLVWQAQQEHREKDHWEGLGQLEVGESQEIGCQLRVRGLGLQEKKEGWAGLGFRLLEKDFRLEERAQQKDFRREELGMGG